MAYDLITKEFPDFDQATLPLIPEAWEDSSWHNDACPCFTVGRLQIYIDFDKVEDRELQGGHRFCVLREAKDKLAVEDVLSTDDWQAVLAFVAKEHQA